MGETADSLFRAQAKSQGYLPDDPHSPGDGRGLEAYYRDHGMISENGLRNLRRREQHVDPFLIDDGLLDLEGRLNECE